MQKLDRLRPNESKMNNGRLDKFQRMATSFVDKRLIQQDSLVSGTDISNAAGFSYNKSISGIKEELEKVQESLQYQDLKDMKPASSDELMKTVPES